MKTYVVPRRLPLGELEGKIFVNISPQALVEEIRQHTGKDIWLMRGWVGEEGFVSRLNDFPDFLSENIGVI